MIDTAKWLKNNPYVSFNCFILALQSVLLLACIVLLNKKIGDIMDINNLVIVLAIGALAGWLAGNIMKGRGFGAVGNIVVGIIGAVLGDFLFSLVGISAYGLIGSIITATVGAIVLLYIISMVKRA